MIEVYTIPCTHILTSPSTVIKGISILSPNKKSIALDRPHCIRIFKGSPKYLGCINYVETFILQEETNGKFVVVLDGINAVDPISKCAVLVERRNDKHPEGFSMLIAEEGAIFRHSFKIGTPVPSSVRQSPSEQPGGYWNGGHSSQRFSDYDTLTIAPIFPSENWVHCIIRHGVPEYISLPVLLSMGITQADSFNERIKDYIDNFTGNVKFENVTKVNQETSKTTNKVMFNQDGFILDYTPIWEYNHDHPVSPTMRKDQFGYSEEFEFDGCLRMVYMSNSKGQWVRWEYDRDGMAVFSQTSDGVEEKSFYDTNNDRIPVVTVCLPEEY